MTESTRSFQRDRIQAFRFVRAGYQPETGEAELVYAFDDGPELVERVVFPGAPTPIDEGAFTRALNLTHWIAGVSYYKAAAPPQVRFDAGQPDAQAAVLLDAVYGHGLAEFAWRNGLEDLVGRLRFPHHDEPASTATAIDLPRRSLVAIGGGKDSLVSTELLRGSGEDLRLFWVGDSPLIAAVAERTGLPTLNIGRRLAPELFEINRQGALNGHVPVTAINSAIGVLAALLYGYDAVVFSNEHSASSATLEANGRVVNHQWSKGLAFEQGFAGLIRATVATNLDYYSLLRPLTELAVTREFARLGRYHQHFSSCNRNFRILGARPLERWCGQCPKCHFVFLALAPFLPKPALVAIFGRNLLDDPALAGEFDALIEWQAHKPFECVGEARESRAAFAALAGRAEWREDVLVRRFAELVQPALPAQDLILEPLLAPRSAETLPSRHRGLIDALRRA